ncbi:MAG: 3-phosphoshikimate 1-carboxyvinyltransferase [Candidatus Gastranaerophilales bacterium]|nr:3-phosphoshikimate 1-carboxyvinyltransferase [Candidatus Gastranaerophilales bacterium]
MQVKVEKTTQLNGAVTIPADKSISHRAVMLGALCDSRLKITNFSKGEDCRNTLEIFKQLGSEVEFINESDFYLIPSKLKAPKTPLYVGNSGTTIRLISGILASQDFTCTISGDESLSKRPMGRIIKPLTLMGAKISSLNNDDKAPLIIEGSTLQGIDYDSPIASAQIKSCLLFAGLHAQGTTRITEPYKSRSHSELMLKYLGANIKENSNTVEIQKSQLQAGNITIAGDISSAAFFLVAGAIVEGADITVKNVGLNPTRTGIIDVLKQMGASIEIFNQRTLSGEDTGDVRVCYSGLKAVTIEGEIIPRLIDELPVIAILASQAEGTTIVKDAQDLRNKESDRIKTVCHEFRKLGVDIEETQDGFRINGKTKLKGDTIVECYHDHRLAMSAYVAGLICEKPVLINNFEWVNTSFPEFLELIYKIKES